MSTSAVGFLLAAILVSACQKPASPPAAETPSARSPLPSELSETLAGALPFRAERAKLAFTDQQLDTFATREVHPYVASSAEVSFILLWYHDDASAQRAEPAVRAWATEAGQDAAIVARGRYREAVIVVARKETAGPTTAAQRSAMAAITAAVSR